MDNIKIDLPKNVFMIINRLYEQGHTAFVVGGCVRDFLLHKTPKDWDIATSALIEESKEIFKDYKILDTGIAHGTISVCIDGVCYELTTYRLDGEYTDRRRPNEVSFVKDIHFDLSRRDFTMNALAYNDIDGLIDDFGGLNDIKNSIVRSVNEPDLRFNEDALRILRAIRFASVLGFEIEKLTAKSIEKNKNLLKTIAKERINEEFSKFLLGSNVHNVFLAYYNIIVVFLPEIKILVDNFDLFKVFLKSLEISPKDLEIRLSLLMHFIHKDEKANLNLGKQLILKNLCYNNRVINNVLMINKCLGYNIYPTKIHIKSLLKNIDVEIFKKVIKIKKLILLAENNGDKLYEIEQIENHLHNILKNNECFSLENLKIDGNDLIQFGIKPGIEVGKCLNRILNMVICEEIENNHEKLKKFLKNFH